MQESQVWSPDWEDSLEKEMATLSIILTWRIPWIEAKVYRVTKTWTWLNMSKSKYDLSNFNFLRKPSLLFSILGTPKFYMSTNNVQSFLFFHIFTNTGCFLIVATLISVRWYLTVVLLCVFLVSRCSSVGKESACHAGDPSSIPGLGRSPGEGMATHSSILAQRLPWTEEPSGLQSMRLQRVGHEGVSMFAQWLHNIRPWLHIQGS